MSFAQVGLDFDGYNDYMTTGLVGAAGNDSRTIELWFKTSSNVSQQIMVDNGSMAISERFTFKVQLGKLRIESGGGGNSLEGTTSVSDNVWHHAAVVYDNTLASNSVTLYLDGAVYAQGDFSAINTGTRPIVIGARNDSTNSFNGGLDEVRVWNYARSAAEIAADMNTTYCNAQTGLIGYYQFEEGTADVDNTAITTIDNQIDPATNGVLHNFGLTSSSGFSNFIVSPMGSSSIVTNQSPILCFGESILVGTSTYNASGNYTDVIVTAAGCDSTVNTSLTVLSEINTSQTINECDGFALQVGTSTYTTSGNYTDVLTSVDGCDSTVVTDLTINAEVVTTTTVTGMTITSDDNTGSYQWIDCDMPGDVLVGETNQSLNAPYEGSFAVVVDNGTCTADTSACVFISAAGVVTKASDLMISAYPNPATDAITLNFNATVENATITVVDLLGAVVFIDRIGNTDSHTLNISALNQGIYLIQIETNNVTNTIKITKG